MRKYCAVIFLCIFSLLFTGKGYATHIMGGDLTYKSVGNNKVELTFLLYRDCISSTNAALDPTITFRAYDASAVAKNDFTKYTAYTISLTSAQKVKPEIPNCPVPTGVCIEQGIYKTTITLGNDTVGYHISWYRNERNNSAITNLSYGDCATFNKQPFGSVWYTFIPRKAIVNSSPQFLTKPIPYLCAGKKNVFNPLASDPDRDSMVFSLVTPYSPAAVCPIAAIPDPYPPGHSSFSKVTYASGYSVTNPFGGTSTISINSTTGEITATPSSAGNYVIAIQVKEYRVNPVTKKTVYVGEIRRDLQFVVGSCPNSNAAPQFVSDSKGYTRYVYPEDTLCFDVEAKDPNDTLYLTASGGVFKGTNSTISAPYATFAGDTAIKVVKSRFCWTPTCAQITYTSPYIVTFNVADNNCNSVYRTYSIYVKTRDIINPPLIQCVNIQSDSTVKLTFYDSVKSSHFKQYKIYRRNGLTGSFTLVDSISKQDTVVRTWIDKKTAKNFGKTVYSYYITAQNTCGLEGLESDTVSTIVIGKQFINDKTVRVSWNRHRSDKVWYRILMDEGSGFKLKDSTQNLNAIYKSCNKLFSIRVEVKDTHCVSNSLPTNTLVLKDITAPAINDNILAATVVNHSTVKLTFNKSDSTDVTWYFIYRADNGGSYTKIDSIARTGSTNIYTYNDTKVRPDTATYCYKVSALDDCKNLSAQSKPHCTINLTGKAGQSEKHVALKWNHYTGFAEDTVELQQYKNKKWTAVWYSKTHDSAVNYAGLNNIEFKCGVDYFFRIVYRNKANTQFSVSDSVKVTPFDTIAPADVDIKFAYVSISAQQIIIDFKKVKDLDVKEYEIYYSKDGSAFSYYSSVPASKTKEGVGWQFPLLDPNSHSYCLRIYALDSCGSNKSKYSETHCVSRLMGKPLNKAAQLNWTKYRGLDVKKYIIRQKASAGSTIPYPVIDSTSDTSYIINNLPCNVQQTFVINIVDETNNNNLIPISDTIILKPYDTVRPAQVNIRNVSVKNGTSITVTFDKVADKDVKKYEIYYSENGGSFSKLTTVNLPFTSPYTYTHTGINTLSKTYSYRVYALDSCADNKSLTSETHTSIQLGGQGRNLSNYVNWNPYKGFKVKNYTVQKLTGKTWTNLATVATDTNYLDTGLSCNVKRYYRIQAFEDSGDNAVSFSDTIELTPHDTIKPASTIIHFVTVNNSNSVSLSWAKSVSKDVKAYKLTRTNHFSADVYMDTIYTDTFYTDTNNIDARLGMYVYEIQAMDSCAQNLSAKSPKFSTIHVHDSISGCEQKIYVKWQIPNTWKSGIKEFEIYRSQDGGTEAKLGTAKGTDRIFTDIAVNNQHQYTYRVKAIQQNGSGFAAFSNTDSIQTFTPETPEILYVSKLSTSETTGQTQIGWKSQKASPHIKYHDVYVREAGTISYILIGSKIPSAQDSFIHQDINTKTKNYEYMVISTDSCGNITDTALAHTSMDMNMTVGQLIHDLVWTPYKGFEVDFYRIEQFLGGQWQHVETVMGTDTALVRFPVACNTNVYYRVAAVSLDGIEALSDSAGGQALDTIPANAPLFNNATVVNGGTIKLNFRGADSLDIFGYAIMRSTDGGEFSGVDFLPINTFGEDITYNDFVNTTTNAFCYTVLTLDSCLNFTASDTFCAIQLKGTELNQALELNWHRFKGYDIDYYLEKWNGTNWQHIDTFTAADTALYIQPLSCNIAQTYRIAGQEKSGSRITLSDTITLTPFDTLLPDAPVLHNATVNGNGMQLSWSWDQNSDVKYFEVWRSDSLQPVFKRVATVVYDSVYLDKSISSLNHIYNYYVRAIDSCDITHISMPSDTHKTIRIKASTLACFPLVWLNWNAYKGLEKGVDHYNIYRADNVGSFSFLTTLPDTQLSFTDSSVTEGLNYCYRIEAVDADGGYTSLSDSVCIVPLVYPLPQNITLKRVTVTKTGTTDGEILLEWTALAVSDIYAVGYKIFVSENGGATTLLQTINDRNITSFAHTGINTRNNIFTYEIYPYNVCDKNGSATVAHKTINLQVENHNLLAKLQWTNYEGFTVDKYEIHKSVNGSALLTAFVLPAGQTSFTDTNIYCGKTYTYRISAIEQNGLNQFSYSDTVNIIAFDTIAPQQSDISVASIARTSTSVGEITIDYSTAKDKNRFGYVIYRAVNNGAYKIIDTVVYAFNNPLQYIDKRLNTVNNTYSYYISSLDSCGNIATPSDTHRAVLLNVTAKSAYNQLGWTAYIGFEKNASNPPVYTIEKFYDNAVGWVPVRTLRNGETTANDSDVHCNVLYTYRIVTQGSLGEISYSNTDTALAFEHILPKVPDIKLATVTATHQLKGEVRLTWKRSVSTDVAKYLLYRRSKNNNWSLLATLPNTDTVYIDNNLNTYRSSYAYQIMALDSCANLSLDESEIHTTVNLVATAEDSRIRLDWNAYNGFEIKEYRLYKNGALLGKFLPNEFTFTDTFVKCRNTYTYHIEAISNADTFVISYSNRDSLQPFDTKAPLPVYLVSASVSKPNHEVDILWAKSASFDAAGYRLYRKNLIEGNTELVFTTRNPNDTFYKHTTDLTKDKFCYFVLAYDDCDNTSASSNLGCIIYLDGKALQDENLLSWNAYEDWPKGVEKYNIYRREDNGLQTLIATVSAADRSEVDKALSLMAKDFCYQVEAEEVTGGYNANSFSTEICLQQQPHIFVPNAFTPGNSLNLNDFFGPQGAYFQKYDMKIFNRWGQRIYETNESKGWDGKSKSGELFTEGVYLYKITVYGYDGTPHVKEGLVYLLW